MGYDYTDTGNIVSDFLALLNKVIIIGAVIYRVVVERYLHSSYVEAYFKSRFNKPRAEANYFAGSPL